MKLHRIKRTVFPWHKVGNALLMSLTYKIETSVLRQTRHKSVGWYFDTEAQICWKIDVVGFTGHILFILGPAPALHGYNADTKVFLYNIMHTIHKLKKALKSFG
jgi:hypothetical protein